MSKKDNNDDIIDYKNGPLLDYILNIGKPGLPNVDFDGDGKIGFLDKARYWEEYKLHTKDLSSQPHEQDGGIADLDMDNLDIQELQELIDDGDLDSDEIDQIQELIKFKEEYDMNLFDEDDDDFDSDDSFDIDFNFDDNDDCDYEYDYNTQNAPKKKEGIWVYYDEDRYKWNFTKALLDYDTKLKEDCGEDCDETTADLLEDIIVFDSKRALDDWHFLLKTFPAEALNETYVAEYDSFNISVDTFCQLSWNNDNEKIIVEFLKQPNIFEYFFEKASWEKHNTLPFDDIFRCLHNTKNDEYIMKVYNAYKNSQKDKYSKRDLSKILENPISNKYWVELPKKVQNDIKKELQGIGDFGKKVLIEIQKYEKELEDDDYAEIDQDEFEDDETEEDDNTLENKIDNAINEKLQKINEFNAKIEPIVADIENGKILDENYKNENKVFDFCFTRGNRICEIVTRFILSKNGNVEDVDENLLIGKIPSSEIETIFILLSAENAFEKYNKIKNGIKPFQPFDKKLIEINTPLIEFICKFYNPAKLILLFDQNYSLCDPIPKIDELKKVYLLCQNYTKQAKQDAKKIFDEITTSGKVVAPWKEEKKLFTYAQLNYPDAIFKYSPDWAKGLCFDIFIPNKNLAIEYVPPLIKNATKLDIEKHKKDMQKHELKRKLCTSHNLIFADWQNETPINETNFLEFMKKF